MAAAGRRVDRRRRRALPDHCGEDRLHRRLVGYRLAPEDPFPPASMMCRGDRMVLARDSCALDAPAASSPCSGEAGGHRDRRDVEAGRGGQHLPAGVHIQFYPICDCAMDTPSYAENGSGYFLTAPDMAWYWNAYGRQRSGDRLARSCSPDLALLPPGLIVTSQYDPLRDEGEALAARINQAGVQPSASAMPVRSTDPDARTAIGVERRGAE